MPKETDTEETIRLFCHIFIIDSISIGVGGAGPLATPMNQNAAHNLMTCWNEEVANTRVSSN